MPESRAPVSDQLARLRAAYVEQLPARIADAVESLDRLEGGGDVAPAALEALRHAAHKLAGSGTTFGLPEISRVARDLELRVQRTIEEGGSAGTLARAGFRTALDELAALARAGRDSAAAPPPFPAPATAEPVSPRGLLLVEPDAALAARIEHELGTFGFAVRIAASPGELAGLIADHPPEAVIADVAAGDDALAGLEALRVLRAYGRLKAPAIVLSDRGDLPARLAAVRAGCRAFLFKPAAAGAIVDALDRLFRPEEAEPYRIMIVDDDPSMARFAEVVLRGAGMITAVVADPMEVIDRMASFAPELLLLDLYMPGCGGQELAAVIRQQETFAGISIVFLSGESDVRKQLSALRQGGDDFLTKPIMAEHLVASVRARVQRFRLLRTLMVRDSMTGLFNHTTLRQSLETEFARAQREGGPIAFALFDLDHFKRVNDTHGHGVGDMVIKSLVWLLRQRLRRGDVIGRLGGEEFGIVLPATGIDDAARICDKIRTAFAAIRHPAEGGEFQVTLSCGIAAMPGYSSVTALSDAADAALAAAKRAGRDRVTRAD